MTQSVTAPPATAATMSPSHTVGVEPVGVELRAGRGLLVHHARAAVVERYNGVVVAIPRTDNDGIRRPLDDAARVWALLHNASMLPPSWPTCDWCGQPDNTCPDLSGHLRLHAGREQTWREPLATTTQTVVSR